MSESECFGVTLVYDVGAHEGADFFRGFAYWDFSVDVNSERESVFCKLSHENAAKETDRVSGELLSDLLVDIKEA